MLVAPLKFNSPLVVTKLLPPPYWNVAEDPVAIVSDPSERVPKAPPSPGVSNAPAPKLTAPETIPAPDRVWLLPRVNPGVLRFNVAPLPTLIALDALILLTAVNTLEAPLTVVVNWMAAIQK